MREDPHLTITYPKTAYGSQVAILGKIMTIASPVDSTMVKGMTDR